MTVHPADVGASSRVIRGGSWYRVAGYCRAAVRLWCVPAFRNTSPAFRSTSLGFRPARRFPSKSLTIHEMKP